jgi:DNA mismatch endonuclease (patch repair protein)
MTGVLTKEQRYKCIKAIRSKDTSVKVKLRRSLFARWFRYRKNNKNLLGSPDIALPRYKTSIFVHCCFWHRHENCRFC